MNTEIYNPDNLESPGEGYRFLYKGETRADATHFWDIVTDGWKPMAPDQEGILFKFSTYRTDKPLPIPTPGFVSEKPPVPPEAIEHGAPSVGVLGIYPAKSGTPIPRGSKIVQGDPRVYLKDESDLSSVAFKDDVDATLAGRGMTYGRFIDNAAVAQKLKGVIAQALIERGKVLPDDAAEAIDMICSKVARLVSGDIDHKDSWRDIEGYARLVRERLEGNAR